MEQQFQSFDKMKRIKTRCWKGAARCESGEVVEIFFTISDFYEGRRFFIDPSCGAVFAVDSDVEHYQKKDFQRLKNTLKCPECAGNLSDVLPYPEHFRCPSTGKMERYNMIPNEAPPDREEFIVDVWDPLT